MKYGYFDDKEREYVIDHPDTPSPWVNYLGSPEYGAIISNSRDAISISVIMHPGTTGPLPGSR